MDGHEVFIGLHKDPAFLPQAIPLTHHPSSASFRTAKMSQYRFHDNLNTAGRPSYARSSLNNTVFRSITGSSSFHNHHSCHNSYGVWVPAIVDDRSDILTWLSPLDPTRRHQDIRRDRVKNIGEWLLQTEEFRNWIASSGRNEIDNAVLFCYGGPGVGKTFIR